MSKHLFLYAKWPHQNLKTIKKAIAATPFSQNGDEGFIIDRVRDDFIEARFVEKRVILAFIVDPFGNKTERSDLEYIQHAFIVRLNQPGLELITPQRSKNRLVSKFLEIFDFNIEISPLNVDPIFVYDKVVEKYKKKSYVRKAEFSKVSLNSNSSASITVQSSSDAIDASKAFVGKRHKILNSIFVSFPNEKKGVVIKRNGAVEISRGDDDLYDAIVHAISSGLKG